MYICLGADDEHDDHSWPSSSSTFLLFGTQALREFLLVLSIIGRGKVGGRQWWERRRHVACGYVNLDKYGRKLKMTKQQELLQTITDCYWGYGEFDISDFECSLAVEEMERKVCGFRWSTFDAMIEELEQLRICGGHGLKRGDLNKAIMCYDTAQRMVSFFLQAGELVRQFQLDNDPQRQRRFLQLRVEIASDLTLAHLTCIDKNRLCSSQQAETIINSAIVALRCNDNLWSIEAAQEARMHFARGCAQKVLNKLEDAERSLLRALELLTDNIETKNELDEMRALLRGPEWPDEEA